VSGGPWSRGCGGRGAAPPGEAGTGAGAGAATWTPPSPAGTGTRDTDTGSPRASTGNCQ